MRCWYCVCGAYVYVVVDVVWRVYVFTVVGLLVWRIQRWLYMQWVVCVANTMHVVYVTGVVYAFNVVIDACVLTCCECAIC